MNCAAERKLPNNEYFELLDQPDILYYKPLKKLSQLKIKAQNLNQK